MAEFERLTLDGIDYEYWFCDDCEHYGEPNGCNRKEGECNQHHVFVEYANRLREYEQSGLSPEQVKAIADAQTWISVKDRLPGNEDEVLVCARLKNGKKSRDKGYYMSYCNEDEGLVCDRSKNGNKSRDKGYLIYFWWVHQGCEEVTHWMPFPELPKEE